jgi:putative heme-binding domain-containing protein
MQYPDSLVGKESAKTLLDWDKIDLFTNVVNTGSLEQAQAVVKALRSHMYNPKTIAIMEGVMMDTTRDMELRKLAVKSFGGPWQSENRLLELAKENKIPQELHTAAGGVFQSAWRATLREEAAAYLTLPGSKEGAPLPSITELIDKPGNADAGKAVFTTLCSNCHVSQGEGVNFGPELSEIGGKLSKEALYTSILFPDQGISFGFEGFRFELSDGSAAVGKIVSETADKVELQYMSSQQTVLKENINSRVKLESSLMPSNLQSSMSEEELVNLVTYLSSLRGVEQLSRK